ncbi:MAG: hypothetical protein GY757_20920, partial [bacterium]|nr:hypothetical protein [bacterium]
FFLNMERGYGLKLPCNPENPYLFLVKPTPKEDYIVFNGYGKTLREYTPVEFFNYVEFFFKELLNLVGREVKVVTGPDERDRYDWLKAEVICPGDLEETARLISGAACFVGVGSAAAAVANGLKAPRLILDWFGTDKPTGERGKTFTLDESSKAVAQRLSTLLTY